MAKKILILGVILIMCLGLFAGCCDVTRHTNSDESIESELEIQIRQDFIVGKEIRFKDLWIRSYYGTYDECLVVVMDYEGYNPPPQMIMEEVAEFEFWYNIGLQIWVWKENNFYSLTLAFENKLLTEQDLSSIWQLSQK